MSVNLLIVESPSKAKTLKKYLGKDFDVIATYGHVRDLVPKQGAVDTEHGFAMQYQLVERNEKHVLAIAKAVKAAQRIYLATDPDREGEAIAWHVTEILKSKRLLKGKELHRVVFYEITQSAVRDAVKHPRDISQPLVNAQQARRALDYLVGFNLSPLLWKKIRRGLSAGRVQSPALRLIVERELEIAAFISQEYWSIHLASHKGTQEFVAKLFQFKGEKLTQFSVVDAERQREIVDFLQMHGGKLATVVRLEKKSRQRQAAAPFTTSTLQQEAVRKLGFSTDRAMKIAQQLYEGIDIGGELVGLISYMRTDSVILSNEALSDIRAYIGKHFSPEYLPGAPVEFTNKSKNSQEAHEAIRPTAMSRAPQSLKGHLTPEQHRLYEMIWKRTLASQMTAARFDLVSVDLSVGDASNLFRATGQTMTFPGFIAVYQEDEDDREQEAESKLPALAEGEQVPIDKLFGEQHFTQPPPRFSEASLVKALEERGIGRPSTYASIISTLLAREYALLDKKRFVPTDVGMVVAKFLTEHFTQYVDYDFTARLEDQLDDVSTGKVDWIPVLGQFWDGFSRQLEEKQAVSRKEVTQEQLDEACPKCGKPLAVRLGKRGKFVGCSGFPECDYTRNVDGGAAEGAAATVVGDDPATGLPILLLNGPYGPYVQLGEASADGKKPKRVSLPKHVQPSALTLPIAAQLLSLPIELGLHPETDKKVVVNIGRFGPYIHHDAKFKSIPRSDDIFTIDLPRAVQLLAEPSAPGRGALRQLGPHPNDQQPVGVYAGRYGAYVKHGKVNATLPPGSGVEKVTLAEALALLDAKAPASRSRKPGTKKATRKSTAPAAGSAAKSPTRANAASKTELAAGDGAKSNTAAKTASKRKPPAKTAKRAVAAKTAAGNKSVTETAAGSNFAKTPAASEPVATTPVRESVAETAKPSAPAKVRKAA
jgi:DNA topoisomerase I